MEFRILGPLQVSDGVQSLRIPPTGPRATVLAALLVHRNQIVPSHRLIEWVWGEEPPEGAAASLHAHISRLRAALEGGPGRRAELLTQSPGYQLRVPPESLDCVCFQRGAEAGQSLLAGDPASAASMLREALSLWRGRALEGFEEQPFARAESIRLEELHLVALEDLMEAEIVLGREGAVIGDLRSLVARHPTRERLTAQLVRALYHAGRQAEALTACNDLRRRLVDELGIEPTLELRRLERAVLRQEVDGGRGTSARGPGRVGVKPLSAAAVPLPPFLTEIGRIFVGRDGDLERLRGLWTDVKAEHLHVVFLGGEPGVGKTRLTAELAAQVHAEGALVLAGRCDEDLGVAYQPFVEALRRFVEHIAAVELSARLGRYPGELARLLPDLGERLPGMPSPLRSDPETERFRLFDAVAAWLRATSAELPVLLVLDDLQWAAKPTLLLLRHLVRASDPMRLLIVGVYRDSELSHDHPLVELLADLRRQGNAERHSLSGLDETAVVAFMEQAADHQLGEGYAQLARAIWTETEGNPFFVREVLRHLAETGDIERQSGRWVARLPVEELGIPEGVREVVGRRLSRLSADTNTVLRVAAVAGAEFELPVVEVAGGLEQEALLTALEEAIRARLVSEVGPGPVPRYRFTHALVRDTVYQGISTARRVTLHRRVAEAVEAVHAARLDDHLPALAHHYARASAPRADSEKAVTYAARAGDRALSQLAHDEAAAYYRQALELLEVAEGPPDEVLRTELLISLGEAERRSGNPAHRQRLLDAARLARSWGDRDALARAALANSRGGMFSSSGVVDAERVAVLEAALALADESDVATRARLLANLGVQLMWGLDPDPSLHSDEALGLARRLGDPATLAHVLRTRWITIASPDTRAERWRNSAELLAVAETVADPALRCEACYFRARSAMELGDIREFDHCLDLAERLAVEVGQPTLQWFNTWLRIGRVLLSGELEEAERLSLGALDLGQASGQPDAPLFFTLQRFYIRFEQGRLGEIETVVTEAVARNPGLLGVEAMLALLYTELDRDEEARLLFEPFGASAFERLPRNVSRLRSITLLAAVAAHLGDSPRAAALHRLLVPYADHVDEMGGMVAGSVAHYLGLLATTLERFDEAEARFAAASATHSRLGAPTLLARTRLEWARMLIGRAGAGDREQARELLGQALISARELGLGNVGRRAAALLSKAMT